MKHIKSVIYFFALLLSASLLHPVYHIFIIFLLLGNFTVEVCASNLINQVGGVSRRFELIKWKPVNMSITTSSRDNIVAVDDAFSVTIELSTSMISLT